MKLLEQNVQPFDGLDEIKLLSYVIYSLQIFELFINLYTTIYR